MAYTKLFKYRYCCNNHNSLNEQKKNNYATTINFNFVQNDLPNGTYHFNP